MAQAQFPEPTPLNILEIGDEKSAVNPGSYSLDKPHPGYGKDPNIINQLGHTIYPKMVYPAGPDGGGKIVNSHAEEVEVMGENAAKSPVPAEIKKPGNDW